MKAKFLSVLLALTMVLSLLPTAVLALDVQSNEKTQAVRTVSLPEGNTGDFTIDSDNAVLDGTDVTYMNGTITVTGNNVTIQNLTFGDKAKLVVNTKGKFTLNKCTFAPETASDNNGFVRNPVKLNVGEAVVTNNTFAGVENGYYNAIEFGIGANENSLSAATISDNKFNSAIKNNYFSFYNMTDNAVINIRDNQLLNSSKASDGVRISNPNMASATFNIINNTFTYNDSGSNYDALILFQDYSNGIQNFNSITLNIEELSAPQDITTLYYVYQDGTGVITTNQPKITGDSSIEKFFVAKVGTAMYSSLSDAVAAAAAADAGDTVTLLKDTTEAVVIPAGKEITLDLNGKTLTNAGGDTITNHGNLTVIGAGTVDNITHTKAALINDGTAVLNGGTFTRSKEAGENSDNSGGNSYYTILNDKGGDLTINAGVKVVNSGHFSSMIRNGGTTGTTSALLINGGSFSGGINTIKNDEGGTLTIKGGDFSNVTQHVIMNWNIANIYDGTFEANSIATAVLFSSSWNGVGGTLNFYGGKVKTTGDSQEAICDHYDANNKGTVTVSGGYFTVDPTTYVADGFHTVASNEDGYTYMVVKGTSDDTTVIVTDKVAADVENDVKDKEAVEAVIGKAAVQNAAKALTDDAQDKLIADAGVKASELDESDTVTIVVNVAIKAVASDLSNTNNATLTFEADPTAIVYVNGEKKGEAQDVSNDMLNGSITVTLPLPEGFTPKQIAHKSDGYRTEYYLDHYERGAKHFTIDENNCAVFDITHFSTFVLSGTQTYVAPSRPSSSTGSTITVGKTENGTITVSPATASKGINVTITARPADGYELGSLTATDANGSTLALTDLGNGKYSFTMPDGKVEVSGTFVKKSAQTFVDVPENAYYAPAVNWAVEKGVTEGTSATTFSPDAACTRAQIVTFLYRAAGSPAVKSAVNPFTDVSASDYYYNAVLWAVENGITTGTSETTFSPNESCTRAQCVTFLYRAVGSAATAKASFTDVSADAYYAPAVDWAVEKGVTTGTSATTFSPDAACTRAQIVTFLYRAAQVK